MSNLVEFLQEMVKGPEYDVSKLPDGGIDVQIENGKKIKLFRGNDAKAPGEEVGNPKDIAFEYSNYAFCINKNGYVTVDNTESGIELTGDAKSRAVKSVKISDNEKNRLKNDFEYIAEKQNSPRTSPGGFNAKALDYNNKGISR